MIKANELRIGNSIQNSHSKKLEIVTISLLDAICNRNGVVNCYNPIPLTPEIMENVKFNREAFELETRNGLCVLYFNGHFLTAFNYVHEIQNLYFALTGKELEIKMQLI